VSASEGADRTARFFANPILNSPYERPSRHWALDDNGQPVGEESGRRLAAYHSPIPTSKKRKGELIQAEMLEHAAPAPATDRETYDTYHLINSVRSHVDHWRSLPEAYWRVTPETARLLRHWRSHAFAGIRPFFCQVEAAEILIWLTEVAPQDRKVKGLLDNIERANSDANPGLHRLALKLATGAGKTTVMAMLIAWQTVNAVRHPRAKAFTSGFLVVTPGITIRERLRVLRPNEPSSYYASRELVPRDMLRDLEQARIVITNYQAFKQRETLPLTRGGRALLRGRGPELKTQETTAQMVQRVMSELMGMKRVLVLNDEAHHCYRTRSQADSDEHQPTGTDRTEARKNTEVARLWISGLHAVRKVVGLDRVIDLSATPFFLRGSGYREGTLFPWTVSDFSLMDAIECGIVKVPRVPVADNLADGATTPTYRNLWERIRKDMPRKSRGRGPSLDPAYLPPPLMAALDTLYSHYERTHEEWNKEGFDVPPCFIVVCHNCAASKLVYDYIAGYHRTAPDGSTSFVPGALALFSNHDDDGQPLPRPRTLLLDSEQLDSGEALDKQFRTAAADEIEHFRRELVRRTGDRRLAENLSDEDLLREAMNTVGVAGQLGGQIRCVVSVSMLTEGWDARTVTHVLGVRAFGTQLLCEQVVGRALRRQSYAVNDDDRLEPEYADVFGVPFDFATEPVIAPPKPPRKTVLVEAIPERDACEIRFPRVEGYRVVLPDERLTAKFTDDATFELNPKSVGAPSKTRSEGIVGEGADLSPEHLEGMRRGTVAFRLTKLLLDTKLRDANQQPKYHLFGQAKRIVSQWLDNHLDRTGGMKLAQILYHELADEACNLIRAAILQGAEHADVDRHAVKAAVLDPYSPDGSTASVRFATTRPCWRTDSARCHVNYAVYDSEWEAEFCRVVEAHPRVRAYVKNDGLGLEVPYLQRSTSRRYSPDFIVLVDDGRGDDDLLHLVVEIKGYRGEDTKAKATTMQTYWVPGVNRLGSFGRWDFRELDDVYTMEADFRTEVRRRFDRLMDSVLTR